MKRIYSLHKWISPRGPIPNSLVITLSELMLAGQPELVAQLETETTYVRFRNLARIWQAIPNTEYFPISCTRLPFQSDDSICIYEVNSGLGIAVQPELMTSGTGGIWKSIPPRVRDWINAGDVKLLISSVSEPATGRHIVEVLWALQRDGANLKNVIFWTGASYSQNAHGLIKKATGVDICRLPYFEAETELEHQRELRVFAPELDLDKKRSKRFMMINRRINSSPHRVAAFLEVVRRDLLSHGHVSMTWQDLDSPNLTFYDRIGEMYSFPKSEALYDLIAFGKDRFQKDKQTILPLKLDVDFSSNKHRNTYPYDYMSNTLADFYADSYFSVIPETSWDGGLPSCRYPFCLISEKTFFAMGCRHPFVMIGAMGDLSRLRELGYKTFPSLVDESYDEIADPTERIQRAIAEVEKLCRIPEHELREKVRALKPDLDHNREMVRKFASELGTIAKSSLFGSSAN